MSSSTSTHSPTSSSKAQSSQIREPIINLFDASQVITYAENTRKAPLPDAEKDEIKKLFASDNLLCELSELHNKFIHIKDNFSLFMGLTEKQSQELQVLVHKVRAYKQLRDKGDISIGAMKAVIANEKELTPLNQQVEWWIANSETMKKLEMWENIAEMIKSDCARNHDPDITLKNRLHKLTDIKDEWISHQIFCGFSSEKLLDFYDNFICKMEGWLYEALTSKNLSSKKWPVAIKAYLNHLLLQIRNLKRSAIGSMNNRLACAEYNNDIKSDDLLVYVCNLIKHECQIDLFGKGKIPEPRRSLGSDLISAFLTRINEYNRINSMERMLILNGNALSMQKIPGRWQRYFSSKAESDQFLDYPVLIFIENALAHLIEQTYADESLVTTTLNTDKINSKLFIINKVKSLGKAIAAEQAKIASQKPDRITEIKSKILSQQQKDLISHITQINTKLEIEIQKQVGVLMEEIFSNKPLSTDAITNAVSQLEKMDIYIEKIMHSDYSANTDLIFALANKIKKMIATNQDITPHHINNILKLLRYIYTDKYIDENNSIKKALARLSEATKRLNEENVAGFLHMIINLLESPTLSKNTLASAIKRHQYIASMYGEEWDNTFEATNDASEENKCKLHILSYLKNVLIKVIDISPYIDFTNFDCNEMLTTLINTEKDTKPQYFMSLKDELQKRTFCRLNDIFSIKSYLHSSSNNIIDLDKLNLLLKRVNSFFTINEYKQMLLKTINESIRSLMKNYFISLIEKDGALDLNYINQANILAGEDMIKASCRDTDIMKILMAYIETYDGAQNNLATLIIRMIPKEESDRYQSHITLYASKRLNFISKSREATPDDYHFFTYYSSLRPVAQLLDASKILLNSVITTTIKKTEIPWMSRFATIVELFGDDAIVHHYRLKRITELCLVATNPQVSDAQSETIFSEFTQTINPYKCASSLIVNANSRINDKSSLYDYLGTLITTQKWSLILEHLVTHCGDSKQLQQLHTLSILNLLKDNTDFNEEWLGRRIAHGTISTPEFFSQFFGNENSKKICTILESKIQTLIQSSQDIEQKELSKDEYKNLLAIITAIKPLVAFYHQSGTNHQIKKFLAQFDDCENKLRLHYQLRTLLKQQTGLLTISTNIPELHNLILSIIQIVSKIQDKQLLSDNSLNQYLDFFDKEVLSRIESIMLSKKDELTYAALFTLTNLMHHLASDNMKLLLLNANKHLLQTNPHWYSLINHLDEKNHLKYLEKVKLDTNDPNFNQPDFRYVFMFAKRLTNIKSQAHHLIKKMMLIDAGIDTRRLDIDRFDDVLSNTKIKDKQLLKLWALCAEKLFKENLHSQVKLAYVNFLIKLLTRISNAIFLRARENTTLLDSYINLFWQVYTISNAMKYLDTECSRLNPVKSSSSLWAGGQEFEKSIRPIFLHIDQTLALQLMKKIEAYIAKYTHNSKHFSLRDYCNDPHYQSGNEVATESLSGLKQIMAITSEDNAVKIKCLIGLYRKLLITFHNGSGTVQLPSYIDNMIAYSNSNTMLQKSKSYNALLLELKLLADKYFNPINDRSILFQPAKRHSLSSIFR